MRAGVIGELCRETAPSILRVLAGSRRVGADLVVDLSEVSFIDAGGISAVVDQQRSCRAEQCDLTLADPSPVVERLLALLRLNVVVERAPDAQSTITSNDASDCASCARLIQVEALDPDTGLAISTCEAFPDGIPPGIAAGVLTHRTEHPGDRGMTYVNSSST